jgi:hypothetical protein
MQHRYTYDAWDRLVKVEERTYNSGFPKCATARITSYRKSRGKKRC